MTEKRLPEPADFFFDIDCAGETLKPMRPEHLPRWLKERENLERAGYLPPLPPDHWALKYRDNPPPPNGNS